MIQSTTCGFSYASLLFSPLDPSIVILNNIVRLPSSECLIELCGPCFHVGNMFG